MNKENTMLKDKTTDIFWHMMLFQAVIVNKRLNKGVQGLNAFYKCVLFVYHQTDTYVFIFIYL